MTAVKRKHGFMLTEMIVGMVLLVILLGGFAVSLGGFQNINHFYLSRQRCIAAAQAQLDCMAVTGQPLDEKLTDELWPKVETSIEKTPGQGQWQGLTLVKVTAVTEIAGRDITVELARYMDISQRNK